MYPRIAAIILFATALPLLAQSGWPSGVESVTVEPNSSTQLTGFLNKGAPIGDLSWASRSSMACFPATQFDSFRGNTVYYAVKIPSYSIMKITAKPQAGVDVNLFAYAIGPDKHDLPPAISSAVSCEASYNFGRPNPGKEQQVQLNAIRNPYNVLIGVSGPAGVTAGRFQLTIDLKTREAEPELSGPVQVTDVASKTGDTVKVQGNLAGGQAIPLRGWADSSQVACFPATQFEKFRGHHVLFRTQLPPTSNIEITAVPNDPSLDLSLYAVRLGANDTTTVPPKIPSAVCEASLDYRDGKPGKAESVKFTAIRNGYNILIGVAAPQGVTSGEFTLEIKVSPR